MSAKTKIAAAAVAVFVVPTQHSGAALLRAKSPQHAALIAAGLTPDTPSQASNSCC